jgi:hypothetical protein
MAAHCSAVAGLRRCKFALNFLAVAAGATLRGATTSCFNAFAILSDISPEIAPLYNESVSEEEREEGRGGDVQDCESLDYDLVDRDSSEVTSNVLNEPLLSSFVEYFLPQKPRLLKVQLGDSGQISYCSSDVVLVLRSLVRLGRVGERLNGRLVVRSVTLRDERHSSSALEIDGGVEGSVDG